MNLFSKSLAVLGLASASIFAGISYSPVTEGSTESAQKLYNFLAVNYGVKTIAGIQTGELETATFKALPDVDSFYVRTGKYPALVGLDFLFATGVKASDDWYQGYTRNIIDAAKDIWAQGGIPAFTWHWKDPSDQVDEFMRHKRLPVKENHIRPTILRRDSPTRTAPQTARGTQAPTLTAS